MDTRIQPKVLFRFMRSKKFNLKRAYENQNFLKFIIREDYQMVFFEIERIRKAFDWNFDNFELFKYSILQKNSFFFEKLFQKIADQERFAEHEADLDRLVSELEKLDVDGASLVEEA